MSRIKGGIKPGVWVEQGEVIGYVGATGLATGPHVCYRFWKNGVQVDALKQDLPKTESLPQSEMSNFLSSIVAIRAQLEALSVEG
jgi:murein DD-endopeptidase MepM/ murein hydrolase activator NlpD